MFPILQDQAFQRWVTSVSLLEAFYVPLRQPYMWKHHVVYESKPHSVIVTLGVQLYKVPKIVLPTTISLISAIKERGSLMQKSMLSSQLQRSNQKSQRGVPLPLKCELRGLHYISLLTTIATRTWPWSRSSRCWRCRQRHTPNHTPLVGWAKGETSMLFNNIAYPMASIHSKMRYYVMFPHLNFVMFF